jgi:hypothetical protein
MRIRFKLSALLAAMAALLLAFASPAMAKGGTGGGGTGGGGGGGGGGGTTAPAVPCAQIVSAVVNANPLPINPNPVYPEPIVISLGTPVGPAAAFDLTVNNQCLDEGGGARSSLAVSTTVFDNATSAALFTGVNMQPAGSIITWRSWSSVPTADTTVPNYTDVVSLIKANGQVQDTLTYTPAAMLQAELTAVATGTPVSLR